MYHILHVAKELQNTKYITWMCIQWIVISLCTKWLTKNIPIYWWRFSSLSSWLPPSGFQCQISQKLSENIIFFTVLSELLDPQSLTMSPLLYTNTEQKKHPFPARSCSVYLELKQVGIRNIQRVVYTIACLSVILFTLLLR